MTESMADRKRKQEKKSGNFLALAEKAGGKKPAIEGVVVAPEAKTAPQGNEGAPATKVKPKGYRGATKALRHALKAKVKAESVKIAATLVEKVTQGDMNGTKIVLTLMEKDKEENAKKKKKRSGPSWAELLASEPEWDESMEDGGKKLAVVSGQ
jgi:hypothetical protein